MAESIENTGFYRTIAENIMIIAKLSWNSYKTAVFIYFPIVYFDRWNSEKMVILAIKERISEGTLFLRTLIFDQRSYPYIEIPIQFTNQASIKTTHTITTVFVKVGSGNIKVFTNLVFADTLCFQYFIYL